MDIRCGTSKAKVSEKCITGGQTWIMIGIQCSCDIICAKSLPCSVWNIVPWAIKGVLYNFILSAWPMVFNFLENIALTFQSVDCLPYFSVASTPGLGFNPLTKFWFLSLIWQCRSGDQRSIRFYSSSCSAHVRTGLAKNHSFEKKDE